MSDSIKNKVVTIVFALFLGIFAIICLVHKPVENSESERRALAQFPKDITIKSIIDKTTIDQFEDYTVDQFPLRETFRFIKANFQLRVLNIKDNNGYAIEDGYIAKIEPNFNNSFVNSAIDTIDKIHEKYALNNNGNTYISIIPDKNYFFADNYGYISPDYTEIINKLKENIPEATYIDIFNTLELSDYYKTDTHWRQENLLDTVNVLYNGLGMQGELPSNYTENRIDNFYGVYYNQSGIYPKSEELVYLTNEIIDNMQVYDYETSKTYGVYSSTKFDELKDGYDLFLHGTRALLRIDNTQAQTDKELIVFRDSYGSSIIPLLAQGYKSVYIVDIRYVEPSMLGMMINFKDKDVLFLYSAMILNSNTFRTLK